MLLVVESTASSYGIRMAGEPNDKFCSLDMLAEVASATLQSDPSLSTASSPQPFKTKPNPKVNILSPSKRSVNGCEKLTLDQIRVLSEKMLIEKFSELSCDEIRKNYSFKCFLIPEKCSQVFKSFGNETRARCKMKTHLLSHISDLLAETNSQNGTEKFTAEPLHARKKRLKEISPKNTRKKKRCRLHNSKKKKEILHGQYFYKNCDDSKSVSFSKIELQNVKKNIKSFNCMSPKINKAKLSTGIEKCTSTNVSDQDIYDIPSEINLLPTLSSLKSNLEQIYVKSLVNERTVELSNLSDHLRKKPYPRNDCKFKKICTNITQPDCTVKWNVDYVESMTLDNSSVLNCDVGNCEQESYIPSHHDHTYTSVLGKTYNCDLSPCTENNKVNYKMYKDFRKSHRCSDTESPLVIPTPPFPYVYVPLLPHIAEIKEVGLNSKTTCSKCADGELLDGLNENNVNSSNMMFSSATKIEKHHCRINRLIITHENKPEIEEDENIQSDSFIEDTASERGSIVIEENEPDTEDDENTPSDSFIDDAGSEDGINSEASDERLQDASFCIDDLLKPSCPENLQAVEKKLALKCIRALRTKKKDERGPLICQICKNKSFTAQATLMYHYRSHAGIKPFSCTVCEATFTRQHSLNYHMLIHNNKSRFVCSDCGRNFRHPSHYKEHLRRHTGETPYECTDCNLRFKTRNTYKRHLKTRHGKILTAQGIRLLSVEEFYKVRTSPRKRTSKSPTIFKRDQETQWPEIVFPKREIIHIKNEMW